MSLEEINAASLRVAAQVKSDDDAEFLLRLCQTARAAHSFGDWLRKSADRIADLQKRSDTWEWAANKYSRQILDLSAEIERLKAELAECVKNADAEFERLEADNARLREGLQFADDHAYGTQVWCSVIRIGATHTTIRDEVRKALGEQP